MKELESQAQDVMGEKKDLQQKLKKSQEAPKVEDQEDKVDAKEVEELAKAFKDVKAQMATELELSSKNQKELESDLTNTKHNLLEIQHQLTLAEKVRMTALKIR